MKIVLIFSFLFGSIFMIKEQGLSAKSSVMNYEQALELSQKTDKPIMLKLTASHCKYCKKMDSEVLSDKEVEHMLKQNFICVTINVDNEPLPLNLTKTITPTFIFVDKSGKITSQLPGSWNKKDFIDLLNNRI